LIVFAKPAGDFSENARLYRQIRNAMRSQAALLGTFTPVVKQLAAITSLLYMALDEGAAGHA